jgi:hypothetical protein
MAATKISSPYAILHALFWTWVNLLQANVSNQARSREEDLVNKPWRPLPSNRMSEETVLIFRWFTVAMSLAVSLPYDVIPASAFLTMTTYLHDDLLGSSHWLTKTILNSFGYFSFEVGATQIVSQFLSRLFFGQNRDVCFVNRWRRTSHIPHHHCSSLQSHDNHPYDTRPRLCRRRRGSQIKSKDGPNRLS